MLFSPLLEDFRSLDGGFNPRRTCGVASGILVAGIVVARMCDQLLGKFGLGAI
ncbi:hypothetical protein [Microcoleus sp. B13-B6]|uniref:hypothetical protein n=1 Tax=Microcoleus sp. B13-B6 TaxID=2818652 RepID=UPI002FD682AB